MKGGRKAYYPDDQESDKDDSCSAAACSSSKGPLFPENQQYLSSAVTISIDASGTNGFLLIGRESFVCHPAFDVLNKQIGKR